jgi:hypothetical protein
VNLRIGLIPDLRETAARLPDLMEQACREGFALSGAEVVEEFPPDDQNAAVILEEVGAALLPYSAQLRRGRPTPKAEAAVEQALFRLGDALAMPRSQFPHDWD